MSRTSPTFGLYRNGERLADAVGDARSFWQRFRGLLGRPPLAPGQGLRIRPCRQVHTLGMAYPLDVVHLDREGRVIRIEEALPPGRVGALVRGGDSVLELPVGFCRAHGVAEGDRLRLET